MSCSTSRSTLNLKVVSGDILSRTLTFKNEDLTAYDLSIYTEIKMEVRKNSGDTVVASGSLTDGDFVVSGVNDNILDMSIQMPELVGLYKYDIEFIGSGIKETLIRGQINLLEEITES
jgi:hypothetical protein